MADLKISQLTAAGLPLAGTEVLPVVQSGVTKQVSVNNLTASKSTPVGEVVATGLIGFPYKYNPSGTWAQPDLIGHRWTGTQDSARIVAPGFYANSSYLDVLASGDFSAAGNFAPIAGKGIDFSATPQPAGMTSELLADYEEGTWTPADGSGAGLTFTVNYAKYTKIGRQVTVICEVIYPATVNASQAIIQGIPYNFPASINSPGFATSTAAVPVSVYGYPGYAICPVITTAFAIVTNATMSGKTIEISITYFV